MYSNRLAGIVMAASMAAPVVAGQLPHGSPSPTDALVRETQVNVLTLIQGNALTATNAALADAPVRLRDVRSGRIVASTRTDRSGLFSFRPVDPGSYIVELVGP